MKPFLLAFLLIGLISVSCILVGCTQQTTRQNETSTTNVSVSVNTTEPQNCSGPVCGSDGKTYSTDCEAAVAGISVSSSGQCPAPAQNTCNDSDEGLNSGVVGTVVKGNESHTDYCIDSAQLAEYTCLDNIIQIVTINCGANKECLGGRCVVLVPPSEQNTSTVPSQECVGPTSPNTSVRQSVVFKTVTYFDTCVEYQVVKDYFCQADRLQSINNQCPAGYKCEDGSCRKLDVVCTDSDNASTSSRGRVIVTKGINVIFDKFDDCVDQGTVKEYLCVNGNSSGVEEIPCASGMRCLSGRCIKSDCSETDGGKNFSVKGTTKAFGESKTDECVTSHILREYYCYGDEIFDDDLDCGDDYHCDSELAVCVPN